MVCRWSVFLLILSCVLVLLPGRVQSSHFRGGIITWRPLSQPDGHSNQTDGIPMIEISYRMAWRRSYSSYHRCDDDDIASGWLLYGEGTLSCTCNSLSQRLTYICTDYSALEDWTTGVNSFQYQPNVASFDVWFQGNAWISLQNGGGSWDLGTTVNLNVRSDTGKINSSPTTSTLPIVRFQRECNNTIKIPVSDADGDYVRCFWATWRCGGICNRLPGAVLHSETCTLKWDVSDSTYLGWYGVAIEIKDYATNTSTEALSLIPLQFLVQLFSSPESCVFKPVFIPPTRVQGSCIGVPPNATYHEPIVVRTGSPEVSITEIDTVSPPGVLYSDVAPYPGGLETDYHVNITWTPATVGVEEILCFTARDTAGSVSQQTCINLVTGTTPPQINTSSLQPVSGALVYPGNLSVQLSFDQGIIRPIRPTFVSVLNDTNSLVYQLDAQSTDQIQYLSDSTIAFTIPGSVFEERESYYILMDPGIGRTTTYCGVESPPVTSVDFWSFTVRDVTPPVLIFTYIPYWTNENATILWTTNEPANTTCILSSPTGNSVVSCEDSWLGVSLNEGYHTLYITATDTSGNVAPVIQVSWFVDLTPPVVAIYGGPEITNQTDATFYFRCWDYRYYYCQFFCGYDLIERVQPELTPCSSPYYIQGLRDAWYKFSLVAVDGVGNRAEEETFTWAVDTQPPSISNISSVTITCGLPFGPNITGLPDVIDNQDLSVQLSYVDESRSDCTFSRLWTATDNAGNTATTRQSLFIDTPLGPQINIPPFRVLACSDNIEAELDILDSEDGTSVYHPCNRPLQVTFSDDVAVKTCGQEFTRFWTVTDDCGNVAGDQQRIQILELVFPEAPANGEVNVELRALLSWPSYPGATSHRVFVWQFESSRPSEPTAETAGLTYHPSTPYPPSTQLLWQIEYNVSGSIIPSPVWGFVTRHFLDLRVNDVILPNFAFSGQTVEVSWEVQNIGQMGISPVRWYDTVYFSITPEPTSLVPMITEKINRFVDPGDGYFYTATWTLPEDLIGTFHVFVETDRYRYLEDFDRSNNLQRADSTLEVRLTPPPDLQVTSVVAPTSTFSGFDIEVRWTVDNLGLGVTSGDEWYDQISISSDGQDWPLKRIYHSGLLSVGDGYASVTSVTVPARIYGDFSVVVATDVDSQVYEHIFENNNELNSSTISVVLTPPPDFQVTNVKLQPDQAITGDHVNVTWEVTNAGNGYPDFSYWYDRVMLSQNGRLVRNLLRQFISEDLPPTVSYQRSTSFDVRDLTESGIYQIVVNTDDSNRIFEFNSENNNNVSVDIEITQRLPDLLISGLSAVHTVGETGSHTLLLNWTVSNVGEGDTTRGAITDTVVLRQCSVFCSSEVLGSLVSTSLLPSGDTYTVTDAEFDLPTAITGEVQIQVTTDASFHHLEGGLMSNAITVDFQIPCHSPQLEVSDIQITSTAGELIDTLKAGEQINVSWNVTNIGQTVLAAGNSSAVVGVSRSGVVVTLRQVLLETELLPSGSSHETAQTNLPIDFSGEVFFQVDYRLETCHPSQPILYGPLVVQPPPTPNLQVTMVTWVPFVPGISITVSWTVTNTGNTMAAASTWYDRVVLASSSLGSSTTEGRTLGNFPRTGLMEAGQSYNTSKTLLLPQDLGDSLFISVLTTFELIPGQTTSQRESQSSSNEPLELLEPELPDLTVQNVTSLHSNVSFGSSLTVSYEVFNSGSTTTASSWTDSIYLIQPFLRSPVGKVTRTGRLETSTRYSVAYTFRVPFVLEGLAQVQVTTDVNSQVRDYDWDNNVGLSESIYLYEGHLSDLVPTISMDDVALSSGAPFTFVYNVTNRGKGDIADTWIDAIYLSQDSGVDPFDVRLASNPTGATIPSAETIQISIELQMPIDLPTATFHIVVDVDSRGEIFEQDEDNNIALKAFEVHGGFSSDLAVTSVTSSSMGVTFGGNIEVDWSVENLGLQFVEGYKCDTVYISDDREWNIMDDEVGKICQLFSLSAASDSVGNRRMYTLNRPMPLVSSGDHFAIVRTRSNIRDLNLENNIGIDDMWVTVSLPKLGIGTTTAAKIRLYEDLAFQIPSVPSDETLIVELSSSSEHDVNTLYVRHKSIASASQFDSSSQGHLSPNQRVTITPTKSGDYYLLVQNKGALDNAYSGSPSDISISVKVAEFDILEVSPRFAAPLGQVTFQVQGTVFPNNIVAKLVCNSSGVRLHQVQLFRFSSEQLYVTFDLSGTDIGSTFNLVLNENANFSRAITIIRGVVGKAAVSVDNSSPRLRTFDVGQVFVYLQNTGNTDILAPVLVFDITNPGESRLINGGHAASWASSHVFIGSPNVGPAGILSPGAYATFTFEVRNLMGVGSLEVSVSILPQNNQNTTNIYTLDDDFYRPFMFSEDRWTRVWDVFLGTIGRTQRSFLARTSTLLNHLSLIEHRPRLVEEVVAYQLDLIDGIGDLISPSLDTIDIASLPDEQGALTIEFGRNFDSRLSYRGVYGAFGRGWTSLWWNIKILSVRESSIIIEENNKFVEFIKDETDGSYVHQQGFIILNETDYLYVDVLVSSLRVIAFDSDTLALRYIDSLGDDTRLTFECDGNNRPTKVTSSFGSSLSVFYTSAGLVESVEAKDRQGITYQTASYEYDITGSYLVTVSVDGETIQYTYGTDGAVTSVTNGRGVTTMYTYSQHHGSLESVRVLAPDSEVYAETFVTNYLDGRVLIVDQPANFTTDYIVTAAGEVGFSHVHGDAPVKILSDYQEGVSTVLVGDHVAHRQVYDIDKNLHYDYDGNGDVTVTSKTLYDPFDEFIDGNGNLYKFEYDEDSRVGTTIYPDGTSLSHTFNEDGFVVKQKSRDGTISEMLLDEDDFIIERNNGDEDVLYFMYDENGRITQATNSVGTIIITYAPSGNPRTVRYPDGKEFIYDYDDQNRRMGIRDGEGYHVSQVYDSFGRVVTVVEGEEQQEFARFEYYPSGLISKVTYSNGCQTSYFYENGSQKLKQILNSCASVASQFDYGYTERNLQNEINTTHGTWRVMYDGADQIISWTDPNGNEVSISYDGAGNRKEINENGAISSYTVNNLNQYIQIGDLEVINDQNGNIIGIRNSTNSENYEYNVINQLIKSNINGQECLYRYNAMGSLHDKECSGVKTQYYMDLFGDFGATLLVQHSEEDSRYYYHGPGLGLLSNRIGEKMHVYFFDGTGSVVGIADEYGGLVGSFTYDPFGNLLKQTGDSLDPFRFSGKFGVLTLQESGLYFMRTRMYNPRMGRFLSPDVLGFTGSPQNLYMYANNNPYLYADPTGTFLAAIGVGVAKGLLGAGAYVATQLLSCKNVTLRGVVSAFATSALPVGPWISGIGGKIAGLLGKAIKKIPIESAFVRKTFGKIKSTANKIGSWISPKRRKDFVESTTGSVAGDVFNAWYNEDQNFDAETTIRNALIFSVVDVGLPNNPIYAERKKAEFKFGEGVVKSTPCPEPREELLDRLKDDIEEVWDGAVEWVASFDPNDILGPAGYGDARFVAGASTLEYRIRFENDVNATAPAQLVSITTDLDVSVDTATFSLGDFGFGNYTAKVNPGSPILQTTIQFDDGRDYVVRVVAGLDVLNRKATWLLQTLDPETGLPPADPGVGFLPPNPENGTDGEGFVTYSVRPRRSAKTYDVIDAEARIIFDQNDPIDTEPTFNTLDFDPPTTSEVSVIDEVISSVILALSIQTKDEGAGVKSVDIYRENDGKLDFVSSGTGTEKYVIVDLPPGESYNLFVVPEDHVANVPATTGSGITSFEVVFPTLPVSCAGVNNCSGVGTCASDNLCQCFEGWYGNDCSQETPPKEPPIIGVTVVNATEDASFEFVVTVESVNPKSNDIITLSLVNVLNSFSSNIGAENGNDLVIPVNQSRDIILQPHEDIAGEFVITVNATVTDGDGLTLTRVADIPVFITPVADEPSIYLEEACFDVTFEHSVVKLKLNVSSDDNDQSEIISVFITGALGDESFVDVTNTSTQLVWEVPLSDMNRSSVGPVNITATSAEVSNGDQASLQITVFIPECSAYGNSSVSPPTVPNIQTTTGMTASTTIVPTTPVHHTTPVPLCSSPSLDDKLVIIGPVQTEYNVGAAVRFSCPAGYDLHGDSCALCVDGKWQFSESPRCHESSCTKPSLSGGMLVISPNLTAYNHSTSVTFSCMAGYGLVGSANATCVRGSWDQIPKCDALPCKRPPDPADNQVIVLPDLQSYPSGTKLQYSCPSGSVIAGKHYLQCTAGSWDTTDTPQCTTCQLSAQCALDVTLRDQEVQCDLHLFGTTSEPCYGYWTSFRNCSCRDTNYRLSSSGLPYWCKNNGQWDAGLYNLTCLAPCKLPIGPNVIAKNSTKKLVNDIIKDSDYVVYSCPEGYSQSGPGSATCINGILSTNKAARCYADCTVPPDYELADPESTQRVFPHGQRVRMKCKEGFPSRDITSAGCSDGNFNVSSCQPEAPITCP